MSPVCAGPRLTCYWQCSLGKSRRLPVISRLIWKLQLLLNKTNKSSLFASTLRPMRRILASSLSLDLLFLTPRSSLVLRQVLVLGTGST